MIDVAQFGYHLAVTNEDQKKAANHYSIIFDCW
jgi:hypothetical protein